MRALVYKAYYLECIARSSQEEDERERAYDRLEFYTPLVKAYCSDRIFEMGRDGIQILGGYGFTKEYPVEQYTRDCKILSIWDGTNYIQSVGLIGRKLRMKGGQVFQDWMDEIRGFIGENSGEVSIADELKLLKDALDVIVELVLGYETCLKEGKKDVVPLTSTRFLDCCAEVAISHLVLEQLLIATEKLEKLGPDHFDAPFYRGKVETARYYVRNFLPNVFGRARIIKMKDLTAVNIPAESL